MRLLPLAFAPCLVLVSTLAAAGDPPDSTAVTTDSRGTTVRMVWNALTAE